MSLFRYYFLFIPPRKVQPKARKLCRFRSCTACFSPELFFFQVNPFFHSQIYTLPKELLDQTHRVVCQKTLSISSTHQYSPLFYDMCFSSPEFPPTKAEICTNSKGTVLYRTWNSSQGRSKEAAYPHIQSPNSLFAIVLQNTHTPYLFLLHFFSGSLGRPPPLPLRLLPFLSFLSYLFFSEKTAVLGGAACFL